MYVAASIHPRTSSFSLLHIPLSQYLGSACLLSRGMAWLMDARKIVQELGGCPGALQNESQSRCEIVAPLVCLRHHVRSACTHAHSLCHRCVPHLQRGARGSPGDWDRGVLVRFQRRQHLRYGFLVVAVPSHITHHTLPFTPLMCTLPNHCSSRTSPASCCT